MVGVSSYRLTEDEKDFLREVQPKGVIYFRRNVDSPNQLIDLTRQVQACLNHPAIIGIDQEGGRVARLSEPFTIFPGNEDLAAKYCEDADDTLICNKAKWMARELKAIGINCDFAPVADILTNKDNPIMKERTFGSDPQVVAALVDKTVRVFEKENILSCAKHFPGHGDTIVDSHVELPFVLTDKKTLLQREIVPFQKAITAKVPMMMTAHIVYKNIDPNNPATLSKYFLQSLLRKKLQFKGCIVSDDLEMKAIAHNYEIDQACVESISVGCNIALVCEDQKIAYQCFEALSRNLHKKPLKDRLMENKKLFRKWDQTYLKKKTLRKRGQWGWVSHQFPQ